MEVLLTISKCLGNFIINKILPKSFKRIIEPGSDLSAAMGAFIFIGIIFVFFYVYANHYLDIDESLDSSGSWNYEQGKCEHE